MDCPFCQIIKEKSERILLETKCSFVVLSDPKLMSGHLLVIPKKHVEKFSNLSSEELKDLIDLTIRMQEFVLKEIAPGCDVCEHYRPFIPDNKFKVSHLHVHIRPRFLDDELYKKVQIFEKDVFSKLDDEEFKKYKELISKI